MRGPKAGDLGVTVSGERLAAWTLGNLNGYWTPYITEGLEFGRSSEDGAAVPALPVAWAALGAARLHYTLATGDIASKSAAGRYAIGLFPGYTDVVTAALAWRATGEGEFTAADWRRCAELALDIVADANRRWG